MEEVEAKLEVWREPFATNRLRISRSKTEYLELGVKQGGAVKLAGEILKKVRAFKYLGSVMSSTGTHADDVESRSAAGWAKWRGLTRVLCDTRMPRRVKGKL